MLPTLAPACRVLYAINFAVAHVHTAALSNYVEYYPVMIMPLFVIRSLADGCGKILCRLFVSLYAALVIINEFLIVHAGLLSPAFSM
jgi:hypothetical protein